ncbi:NAD(P)H-binding protein [Gordonia paraffinivorans]|uniref:NADH-flavin reductase n=1 Tax=Gordonia paraffinivorans TaxID=175628 RepID=A0ABD7V0Q2_9ACTN|nr:NAD(P)H-binding protein [Gordonia paraffinivorans]MCD2143998.1 NAD(P)H-binding protein [Gordonia paraffinivorans]VFA83005.1 Putative NADH-flavin reductase [Gordonia paraffinivorans]
MRLLITGATGYVGSRLVCALLKKGHDVVVTSRDPRRLDRFSWSSRVTKVAMDADDASSVKRAMAEAGAIDAVYYLVHGIGQADFANGDRDAARNVAEAARDAGVGRIIYLGGFVPADDELSSHLQSRADVAEGLTVEDGPELVWLRAAVIIGAGSTSFEIIRYMADRLPVIPEPAWIVNEMDPISIRDAIHYLVASCESSLPPGEYDISGPDHARYISILHEYISAVRFPRLRLPVYGVSTRLAGRLGGRFVPVPSSLTEELVTSLNHPMTASEHRIRDLIPPPEGGLTPMRDAVRASVHSPSPRPVCDLDDLHHLAVTDPAWAGGDLLRAKRAIGETIGGTLRMSARIAGTLLPSRG